MSAEWRRVAMIAVALLGIGVVLSLVWPRGEGAGERPALPDGPAPPCPFGYVDHVGRKESLLALLNATDEGRRIVSSLGASEVRFCFGRIDVPVVSEGRLLLLDQSADDAPLAARTAHLFLHIVNGPPVPDEIARGADCDAIVDRALHAEARAYAVEVRLRRELGVAGVRYEFEPAFWASEDGERTIYEYLVAHPDGGPGLDALGTAYRQRCETLSRRR
jgi:hypothetical protein